MGRGTAGKFAVMGARARTGKVIAEPLKPGATFAKFVYDHVEPYSVVYTDDHKGYANLKDRYYHETVSHSTGEYVRGEAHTNGIESFWAIIKRGYKGVYHSWSCKHLHRYIREYTSRYNMRSLGTLERLAAMARGMEGKQLQWSDLVA